MMDLGGIHSSRKFPLIDSILRLVSPYTMSIVSVTKARASEGAQAGTMGCRVLGSLQIFILL